MLNVATSSATPANTVRKVVKRSRKSLLMSLVFSLVRFAPVIASVCAGSTRCTRFTSSSWETPGSAFTEMVPT